MYFYQIGLKKCYKGCTKNYKWCLLWQ